jgi:PncC family amidohydrolase
MIDIYPTRTIQEIRDMLASRRQTIAFAESVTAGHLQAAFSQAENAREVFQGGMTVYNIGQKCRQLGVEPIEALAVNGVSEGVSEQLAGGIAGAFCSYWGVGITGYAAPVPEKQINAPYAIYSVYADKKLMRTARIDPPPGSTIEVQLYYVRGLMGALHQLISTCPATVI